MMQMQQHKTEGTSQYIYNPIGNNKNKVIKRNNAKGFTIKKREFGLHYLLQTVRIIGCVSLVEQHYSGLHSEKCLVAT